MDSAYDSQFKIIKIVVLAAFEKKTYYDSISWLRINNLKRKNSVLNSTCKLLVLQFLSSNLYPTLLFSKGTLKNVGFKILF